jgi:hypothetical protein
MDPISMMLVAQGVAGGFQFLAGLAKKRKPIDTSMQQEFQQNEAVARNMAQSTSQSFDIANRRQQQQNASGQAAALRSAQTPGGFARLMAAGARQASGAAANLFAMELNQKRADYSTLMGAKLQTAQERNRVQGLKNSIALQENAYKDRLISSGLQNVFGASSGFIDNQQFNKTMEAYGVMSGRNRGGAGQGVPFGTGVGYPVNTDLNVIQGPNFGPNIPRPNFGPNIPRPNFG